MSNLSEDMPYFDKDKRYRKIKDIGFGSYGHVWQAQDELEHREVAIKEIPVGKMTPKELKLAKNEVEIGQKGIPGVVKVLNTFYDDQNTKLFIVMELMQSDLSTRIKDGRIAFAQALEWAIDLCETLQEVHEKYHIIHKDIKPQNILLDGNNNVYFCDFGIARLTHVNPPTETTSDILDSSVTISRRGDPSYEPPEVRDGHGKDGHKTSPASDVFSLCAVLFELWFCADFYVIGQNLGRLGIDRVRREFSTRLARYYAGTPADCRLRLANAILMGLTDTPKERISLKRLRDELFQIQQDLDSQNNPDDNNQPDHSESKEPFSIIQRGIASIFAFSSPLVGDTLVSDAVLSSVCIDHAEEVNIVAWARDGKCLASASIDGTIHLWGANNLDQDIAYRGHQHKVVAMEWSLDGRYIASASASSKTHIQVWDTVTRKTIVTDSTKLGYIINLKWFANELCVVLANTDGVSTYWIADTKHRLVTYKGHTKLVCAVAWSPDGQYIATASSDKTVKVWKARTGGIPNTYKGHIAEVDVVAWSPDGKLLASAGRDQTVQVWEPETGVEVFTYRGHSYGIFALSWSPDSKRIASSGGDHTVQVWNAVTGRDVIIHSDHSHNVLSLGWSPCGTRIASAGRDRKVQVWNATKPERVFTYHNSSAQQIHAIAWSPKEHNEQLIAAGTRDGTIHVYCVPQTNERHIYCLHNSEVTSLAWSPNGHFIASASKDKTVQVWNVTLEQRELTYRGHMNEVYTLAWSPDSEYIASAGKDQTVQVWDIANERMFFKYDNHSNDVYTLAWSPDGKYIASAGKDRIVQVWDVANRSMVSAYKNHSNEVFALTWSPDSKYVASASKDHTVHVWKITAEDTMLLFEGHTYAVSSVAWSPVGQQIASASYGTVQVWNAYTGKTFLTHHLHFGEVNALAWSYDGQFLASAGYDKTLRVWQMTQTTQ
jgi:WD40 repeat protein